MRLFQFVALGLTVLLLADCSGPAPSNGTGISHDNRPSRHAGARDLAADEAHGGHTLKKHVGRSDAQLRERLERENNISAASTYTDRHTAEEFVGDCLSDNNGRIGRWLERDRHPNLVLDCAGDPAWPIGRSLRRGESQVEPCSKATVVLKWEPPHDYYVLTSYPECR